MANPLGASKRKQKMCAVHRVIANLPGKYRSALNSIQLALLCNAATVKECGYDKILHPLLCDLASIEQHGVYIEHLGKSVKGTVLYVSADNLGAHSHRSFMKASLWISFADFALHPGLSHNSKRYKMVHFDSERERHTTGRCKNLCRIQIWVKSQV